MSTFDSLAERDLSWFYGDGSDGDVTISGAVTLTKEMHYRNLTMAAGASLKSAGARIFVRDVLDLSSAPSGAFTISAKDGGDASVHVGGTTTGDFTGVNGFCMGGSRTYGATGVVGAGVNGANLVNYGIYGGKGGSSGAAGAGASGAGGTAATALVWWLSAPKIAGSFNLHLHKYRIGTYNLPPLVAGGNGASGGSGAGDGANKGGGGGGGGSPGDDASGSPPTWDGFAPLFWIGARVIQRGTNANTGIFDLSGGNGGNGGTPAAGNCGGGGGGGGAGGGTLYLCCDHLLGSTITDAIDVTGGDGGDGGGKTGTGVVGVGGDGGGNGEVAIFECSKAALTYTAPGTSVSAGGAQAGAGGTAMLVDL